MSENVRTGVFLCDCGKAIGGRIQLAVLESGLKSEEGVAVVRTQPRYCLAPGLADLSDTVERDGLNRVVLGACSDRIMKHRFAGALQDLGLLESQIDVVNLKDHVALAHDESGEEPTRKAATLLAGAVAGLRLLEPRAPVECPFEGAAIIAGDGISGFEAARELSRNGLESVVLSKFEKPADVLASLPSRYPGSRYHFRSLETLLEEVYSSPLVTVVRDRPVESFDGRAGGYRLGLKQPDESILEMRGAAVILAMDREYVPEGGDGIGDGGRIMDQVAFEACLAGSAFSAGEVVFWVRDDAGDRRTAELCATAAWNNSRFLTGKYPGVSATILHPADIRLPLTGADLMRARSSRIRIHAYDPHIRPVVQSDFLTFVTPKERMECEIGWSTLVVPSVPGPPAQVLPDLARYLPVFSDGWRLKKPPLRLKAGQKPVAWTVLAGSAQEPCSLDEALQQGKSAAWEVLGLRDKSRNGGLAGPAVVASVDPDLCEGCGLCNEICTCGAISHVKPGRGPAPRSMDPHACSGCGSCAAACPYGAIRMINNDGRQLEAKVRRIVAGMKENDVLGFVCSWGGQGAAELAAVRGLKYSSRLFMIPVPCLGSVDPYILSLAFLNGANFVMLAGCRPTSSCHFGHGIDHAWFRVNLVKRLLELSGLDRRRVSLGYVDADEPEAFVKMVDSFIEEADLMGPIDRADGQRERLRAAHAALHNPRLRWVLGTSLRRVSEMEFPSTPFNAYSYDEVVRDIVEEEYLAARILGVLAGAALDPPQIVRALGESLPKVCPLLDEMVKGGRVSCNWGEPYPVYTAAGSR